MIAALVIEGAGAFIADKKIPGFQGAALQIILPMAVEVSSHLQVARDGGGAAGLGKHAGARLAVDKQRGQGEGGAGALVESAKAQGSHIQITRREGPDLQVIGADAGTVPSPPNRCRRSPCGAAALGEGAGAFSADKKISGGEGAALQVILRMAVEDFSHPQVTIDGGGAARPWLKTLVPAWLSTNRKPSRVRVVPALWLKVPTPRMPTSRSIRQLRVPTCRL